mgnify:FL=1
MTQDVAARATSVLAEMYFYAFIFIDLIKNFRAESEKFELPADFGHCFIDKFCFLIFQDLFPGVLRDKEAESTLVVDYSVRRQFLVGTHYRVRIYAELGPVLPH